MSAPAPPKVPAAVKPVFDDIVPITDLFCHQHLDAEYAELCVKLARKRPSPLLRGDRRIWAAGIVYAIGRVNFLADPNQKPHLRTDGLADLLGVKQTTMANKGGSSRTPCDRSDGSRVQPARHDGQEPDCMAAGGRRVPRRRAPVSAGTTGAGVAARSDPVRTSSPRSDGPSDRVTSRRDALPLGGRRSVRLRDVRGRDPTNPAG
jgi:hypothetical protein